MPLHRVAANDAMVSDVDPWSVTSYLKLKKWLLAHGATKTELFNASGLQGLQRLLPDYGVPKPGAEPPKEDEEAPGVVIFPKSLAHAARLHYPPCLPYPRGPGVGGVVGFFPATSSFLATLAWPAAPVSTSGGTSNPRGRVGEIRNLYFLYSS